MARYVAAAAEGKWSKNGLDRGKIFGLISANIISRFESIATCLALLGNL
jgi:hypothetical protein